MLWSAQLLHKLMVPVHADVLYLRQSEAVAEPTADFRDLPYYDCQQQRDVNSDTPWLGDSVVSPPFENSNMTLQAGVHLHWSLPDSLCHGKAANNTIEMPVVPNRWLIRRRQTDNSNIKKSNAEEKTWIVESDYLWPEIDQAPAINIFHSVSDKAEKTYRFLGRSQSLEDWQAGSSHADRLENLTAIGYGEPTFAAYYPNCMTVFGFHDRDLPENWKTLHYDIIGWYCQNATPPKIGWENDPKSPGSKVEPLRGWRITSDDEPEQFLCYASVELTDKTTKNEPLENPKVAIGNTVSEALSALIAHEIAEENFQNQVCVEAIEEQLEALHIEEQLTSATQDRGLQLLRYRHQKSFAAVSGIEQWTLQTQVPSAKPLPDSLVQTLRKLNQAQTQYGRLLSQLAQARRQLYGDWCKYMQCVYRPTDSGQGHFLDIDEARAYVENKSLATVEYLSGIVESARDRRDNTKEYLADQVVQLNLELKNTWRDQQAQQAQQSPASSPPQYRLQVAAGARYWQPTDPVVLLAGTSIQHSNRHGQDGRNAADGCLQCELYETSKSTGDDLIKGKQSREAILQWLEEQFAQQSPHLDESLNTCIGFRKINVKKRPWNPLFLDWGVDMHPAESHSPTESDFDVVTTDSPVSFVDRQCSTDVILENYQLGSQKPDLQLRDPWWIIDNPDRFSGRCILGDTPALALKERIEGVLNRRLLGGEPDMWASSQDKPYYKEISGWCKKRPHALPTTVTEMEELLIWYKERPLKSSGKSNTSEVPTLETATVQELAADPLYCTLLAYQKLFQSTSTKANAKDANTKASDKDSKKLQPRAFLAQALTGFNGELIQWKLGLSLPIDEPIGLASYREFTRRVAALVGDETDWITEPTNNFSPIRSGALKLDKLRLVDSFGQVSEVACDDKVIVPSPYQSLGRSGVAFLPPRLVQPARVTFRWLAAHVDRLEEVPGKVSEEMVEAATQSPICGWLLPEKLRGRLLVFDGDGNPLGAIAADKDNANLEWVPAPGLPALTEAEYAAGRDWLQTVSHRYYNSAVDSESTEDSRRDLGQLGASLQNQRLARVLLYLLATKSAKFLENFLNTLDDAIANIDPEGTTSLGSLALLIGRPVAVVGAELNLELKDEPAIRQDWGAFLLDQYRNYGDTDRFTQVQFRLRLGQYQSRNDGVLGYWLEKNGGFEQDTFTAQAANDDDLHRQLDLDVKNAGLTFKINAHEAVEAIDDLNFTQSVADSALQTTLLFDPRGSAHLTTGILPVKRIDIPRSLWEPALEAMRVWLPVAPFLSRPQERRVPTPALVDRQWRWLEKPKADGPSVWRSLTARPTIHRDVLEQELNAADAQLRQDDDIEQQRLIAKAWLAGNSPFDTHEANAASKKHNPSAVNQLVAHCWLQAIPLPTLTQLIEKDWLAEQTPPSDRLYILDRESRHPLEEQSLEIPLETLLSARSLALTLPGDEPDFNPGIEVREGWLLLEAASEKSLT